MNVDIAKMKSYFINYKPDIDDLKSQKINRFKMPGRVASIVNKFEKKFSKKYYVDVKEINRKIDEANNKLDKTARDFELANKVHIGNSEELLNCFIGKRVLNAFIFMCNVSIGQKALLDKMNIDEEIKETEEFCKKYKKDNFYDAVLQMIENVSHLIANAEYRPEKNAKIFALGRAVKVPSNQAIRVINGALDPQKLLAYKKEGDKSGKTYAQRFMDDVDLSLRPVSQWLEMSGKPMLESIKLSYAPYLEEAEKISEMLKRVDRKVRDFNSKKAAQSSRAK